MRPKKLKIRKSFKPLPCDAGDELYLNGIFEFNITKLLAFINENLTQFPVEQVELSLLGSHFSDHLDNTTVESANIQSPIILAEISPGRFNVIDGNHRVEKARRLGLQHISAYRIKAEDHMAFLTSRKAYEAYVAYWNEKIEAQ